MLNKALQNNVLCPGMKTWNLLLHHLTEILISILITVLKCGFYPGLTTIGFWDEPTAPLTYTYQENHIQLQPKLFIARLVWKINFYFRGISDFSFEAIQRSAIFCFQISPDIRILIFWTMSWVSEMKYALRNLEMDKIDTVLVSFPSAYSRIAEVQRLMHKA